MAICANQGRMYMGTARQYMDQSCKPMQTQPVPARGMERREERCMRERVREDGCQPESLCADLPLVMAYVNPQPYTGLVSGEVALSRGSSFNNLYDPWKPGQYC